MKEENTLDKSDFNLEKEYELFDVFYTISKKPFDNEVKAWTVIGHVLDSGSNHRCFITEVCSFPISVYVLQNKKCTLENLKSDFISRNRNEVIELKKELLKQFYEAQLNNLK